MKFLQYILLVGAGLLVTGSIAQDIHFSMYDMSPLTLNPAHTGMMESDQRICNIYRTQWKAIGDPLNTYAISYDRPLYALPHNISAGLVFVSDKSGGIQLVENRFMLSTAVKVYHGLDAFSFGVQLGYVNKAWAVNQSTFPEQYSREIGQFDWRLSNGESNYKLTRGYLDINAGMIWNKKTSKGTFTSGVAVMHANSPDDTFFKEGKGLKPRFVFHSKYDFKLSSKWFLRPSILMTTLQKAQDFVATAAGGVMLGDNPINIKRIWFGMAVRTGINRNGDSAIPTAGIDKKYFDEAAAYDINFSELQLATNNRGAFEIALIYHSRSTAIDRITIPCDRF